MATTAQIIANRRTKLVPGHIEGNYYIRSLFMQNKPNFRKAKMNITSAITKDYENETTFNLRENKPNQTQFQYQICKTNPIEPNFYTNYAKQTQSNPILSAIAFAKADSNAGSKGNEAIAASNLKAYGQRGVCRKLAGQ